MKKRVIIFSLSGASRAIYRKLKVEGIEIIAFVDNNPNLVGTLYNGIKIYSPNSLESLNFDKIVFGGIWQDDIKKELLALNIPIKKILIINDCDLEYSDEERVKATDKLLKEFSDIMKKNNLSYFMEGSSLLCLLRNQDLSKAQDIDIMIKSLNDLEKLYLILQEDVALSENQIIRVLHEEDTLISKKGELKKIIIKSNTGSTISEPAILDITALREKYNFYLVTYEKNYYFYYKKEGLESEKIFKYKDIELLIPKYEESFLESIYGKDWINPVTKWTTFDYKNLIDDSNFNKYIINN
ncbi:hypothetical protein [Aliarcobacter butzleri]|uniref:hypothetical protein n=1 Tax=Aliarcobacter butzleri TaxID=28197 RepID=UPI003AF4EBD6